MAIQVPVAPAWLLSINPHSRCSPERRWWTFSRCRRAGRACRWRPWTRCSRRKCLTCSSRLAGERLSPPPRPGLQHPFGGPTGPSAALPAYPLSRSLRCRWLHVGFFIDAIAALPCLLLRPEMVVGWYHSHPGFGCWLSGVDVNTQQSFEALNQRAVAGEPARRVAAGCKRAVGMPRGTRDSLRCANRPAAGCWPSGGTCGWPLAFPSCNHSPPPVPAVVVDPIQSVKGKVVIDAFRCIRCARAACVAELACCWSVALPINAHPCRTTCAPPASRAAAQGGSPPAAPGVTTSAS